MNDDFSLVCISKLKHGELWKAMRARGWNQTDLADYLGLNVTSLGNLINMRWVPKFSRPQNAKLKRKLEDLTGKLVEDLFPEGLLTPEFLQAPKTFERMAEIPQHLLYGEASGMLSLPLPPDEILMDREKMKMLREAVEGFGSRRLLIFDRLCQGNSVNEIASELRVTPSAVSAMRLSIIRRLSWRFDIDKLLNG